MLTFTSRFILLLSCIIMWAPLSAMKKRPTEAITASGSQELVRDHTQELDLTTLSLQSPEKKSRSNTHKMVNRAVKRLIWQEALVAETQLPTLFPIEQQAVLDVPVDPLAHAIYYDDIDEVVELLKNPTYNLDFTSNNLLEHEQNATILDIAAERRSYLCLEYFAEILNCRDPIHSLEVFATQALPKLSLPQARELLGDKVIAERHILPTIYALKYTKPKLINLVKKSQTNALRISRKVGDLRGAQLLWDCIKRQDLFK